MADRVNPRDFVTAENERAFSALGRTEFAHMSKADAVVWRAFLRVNPWRFSSVAYDVQVGGVLAGALDDTSGLKPMWESLLKKRIDAVAFFGAGVLTIEVKPLANMSALGQALSYRYLWEAEPGQKRKARAMVVCARVDADIDAVFRLYDVSVAVVGGIKEGLPRLEAVLGPMAGEPRRSAP